MPQFLLSPRRLAPAVVLVPEESERLLFAELKATPHGERRLERLGVSAAAGDRAGNLRQVVPRPLEYVVYDVVPYDGNRLNDPRCRPQFLKQPWRCVGELHGVGAALPGVELPGRMP